jgi:predicted nucleic acid-binding protein
MSDEALPAVILDTNVFVGAGFNPSSSSAKLVEAVRAGRLRMVWSEATRGEVEGVLSRIPPLSWAHVAGLFRREDEYRGETRPMDFGYIRDPADRKFAALSDAADTSLVTSDDDLLRGRKRARVAILTPAEFVQRYQV